MLINLILVQKYAAIAAGTTALAGTVIGTALPWLAAIAVPSVPVAAGIGLTTAAIKVRHWHNSHFSLFYLHRSPFSSCSIFLFSSRGDIEETTSGKAGSWVGKDEMREKMREWM